jgi:hypothetical protein
MVVMPTVEMGPQVDRPLTVADLEELQDEGYRYCSTAPVLQSSW